MCRILSFRLQLLATILIAANSNGSSPKTFETVHTSNAAILNRLGLIPLVLPDGHHKKRLAGPEPPELSNTQSRIHQPYSRRHGHRDSHVYVVKLPASPPYYTITKPHKSSAKDNKITGSITATNKNGGTNVIHQSPSVGFHSNGKPAKIYHWNLPVVKKMSEKKRIHAQFKMEQLRKKFETEKIDDAMGGGFNSLILPINALKSNGNFKRIVTNDVTLQNDKNAAIKHTRNNDKILNYPDESRRVNAITDTGKANGTNKMFRLEDSVLYKIGHNTNERLTKWEMPNELHGMKNIGLYKLKKHRKKAAMSYYAPITTKTGSTSIHKNFPGNGKPKAFYVMEKSRKPVYYHPLLP